MTFSIVGRSADGRLHGVAVASKFLAAGALVPAAEADLGAVATQAHLNLSYRPKGLDLLRSHSAEEVVAALTDADPERDHRQVGVVGATGDGASFTGAACHDWAGHLTGDGYAVQGNILAGPHVLTAMRDAWLAPAPAPDRFAERLLRALAAGDAAGGDRRGRQSAGLYVVRKGAGYGGTGDVLVDLRADDHPDPVAELSRLLAIHVMLFEKPDPATLLDLTGDLATEVTALLARAGHPVTTTLDDALASWAGIENLEERLVPGRIDPLVLSHLRNG